MQARMNNPMMILPDALEALQALHAAAVKSGVSQRTLELSHLRASQINGCAVCVLDWGVRPARKSGERDERLFAVSVWREAPFFTDAERAALALTEAVTRLSDQTDPVPDDVWEEATKHYDEKALAGLMVSIAGTNAFNRLNVATRQIPDASWD